MLCFVLRWNTESGSSSWHCSNCDDNSWSLFDLTLSTAVGLSILVIFRVIIVDLLLRMMVIWTLFILGIFSVPGDLTAPCGATTSLILFQSDSWFSSISQCHSQSCQHLVERQVVVDHNSLSLIFPPHIPSYQDHFLLRSTTSLEPGGVGQGFNAQGL